jgi:hypothetical protein
MEAAAHGNRLDEARAGEKQIAAILERCCGSASAYIFTHASPMNKLGPGIFFLAVAAIVALWTVPNHGLKWFIAAGAIVGITSLVWGIYSAYRGRWTALFVCLIAILVLLLLLMPI